jgi:hypothetical protein
MSAVVIDTNVLHVANQTAQQAGPDCVLRVVQRLEAIRAGERVCLDHLGLILQEYIDQRFQFAGQPGVGNAFFRWLFVNQANEQCCEVVTVHPTNQENTAFQEFPNDPALAGFDPSDRKFVAVALASKLSPKILNAVDSDWWDFREALSDNGVAVDFLCPNQFGET